MTKYDAIIIGSGPGGYACAIKIAQLGGRCLVIEKEELGGCCTNWGCIPTKTLHYYASLIEKVEKARKHGLKVKEDKENVLVDFKEIMKQKENVVDMSRKGVGFLLKENNVELVKGEGKILDKEKVEVGGRIYETKNIVIATGAEPILLSGIKDENDERILTCKELLRLVELPKSLAIVGGGVVGCEFASVFNALGVEISIYEEMQRLLPSEDEDIGVKLEQIFKRKGVNVHTGKKFNLNELKQEKILLAIGSKPNFNEIEMKKLSINYDKGISIDKHMRTSVRNIYAIGDVTGMGFSANAAYEQARVAAINIMSEKTKQKAEINYDVIPRVIFTIPEVASVGIREGKTATFPYAANGKARTSDDTEGFIKLYYKNKFLNGCTILGSHAEDIINIATICIKNKLKLEDIKNTVFAHPTLSESFIEAVKLIRG